MSGVKSSSFQKVSTKRPALFLDRDGTVMQEVDHCHRSEDVFVYPGVKELLHRAGELGWYRIIITNQSGIGRGYFTVEDFESVQAEVQHQVEGAIDASYFAPDVPGSGSLRRKPEPGMILEAARDFPIDLAQSWMIGDRGSDIGCGKAAGCRTALVLTGYGEEYRDVGADLVASDITEVLKQIL